MRHFKLHKTDVYINYLEEFELVKIRLVSPLRCETTINIEREDFLNFIIAANIVEVKDGIILWDEYIEDDGETTRFNQHEISLFDYISNYLSSYDLFELLILLFSGIKILLFNQNQEQ